MGKMFFNMLTSKCYPFYHYIFRRDSYCSFPGFLLSPGCNPCICDAIVIERVLQAERAEVRTQIHSLSVENKQFRSVLDEKRREMEPLQQALGKLRGSSGSRDNRGAGVCSSEAELNDVVSLHGNTFYPEFLFVYM